MPLTRTVTVFAPVEVSIVAGEIETPVSVGAVASPVAPNAADAIHSAVINAIPHVRPAARMRRPQLATLTAGLLLLTLSRCVGTTSRPRYGRYLGTSDIVQSSSRPRRGPSVRSISGHSLPIVVNDQALARGERPCRS